MQVTRACNEAHNQTREKAMSYRIGENPTGYYTTAQKANRALLDAGYEWLTRNVVRPNVTHRYRKAGREAIMTRLDGVYVVMVYAT